MNEKSFEGTERLYYTDSELTEFDACVLSCEKSQKQDGIWHVVLDKTAFFPEGGGQFGDTGELISDDITVNVTDTHEKNGTIIHYTDRPVNPGETVRGKLNYDVRFDRMQQHSGEHIVSGLVNKLYGYNNVGFHLGNDITTLDFDGPLSREQIENIEKLSNEGVFKNVPVNTSFPTKEEEKNINYRSKIDIEGQVRLVEIPGYDLCACCAPHVKKTGEIGIIKIISAINYKGGMRVTILAGRRALKDYAAKHEDVHALSEMYSVPAQEVLLAVSKAKEESENRKGQIVKWQQMYVSASESEIFDGGFIFRVFPEIEMGTARSFVNDELKKADTVFVFVKSNNGFNYIIGSNNGRAGSLSKKLNEKLTGRGGGKPEMAQGSVEKEPSEAVIRDIIKE